MPKDSAAIQKDLMKRLERQDDRNIMEFKKGKCKVLHLWRNKLRHQYKPGATQLESSLEKNSGSWWTPS